MQVFESDVDFKRAIAKRLKYGTGKITDASGDTVASDRTEEPTTIA
jgi:hypothetical protein